MMDPQDWEDLERTNDMLRTLILEQRAEILKLKQKLEAPQRVCVVMSNSWRPIAVFWDENEAHDFVRAHAGAVLNEVRHFEVEGKRPLP
jgi:hypothetical protein